MFEKRERLGLDAAQLPPDKDEQWEESSSSFLSSLAPGSALRRALSIVPLAVIGFAAAWYFYFDRSNRTAPAPVVEAKAEPAQPVPPATPPAPPPQRVEIVETAPPPAPPVSVAAVPPAPSSAPAQPLSREEIKELQGKLSAVGFSAGPVDGVVGPQTQAALRRYAEARSLAKPEANREVLTRLRSEPPAQP